MEKSAEVKEVIKSYFKDEHVPVVLFDRGKANIVLKNNKGASYSIGYFLCDGVNNNHLNKNLNIENNDKFSLYIENNLLLRMIPFQGESEKDFNIQMNFYFNFRNKDCLQLSREHSSDNELAIFELENIEKEIYVNGIKFIATLNGVYGYKYFADISLDDFIAIMS